MLSAIRQAGLDAGAVRDAVEAVLSEALYWFPVRHHSPTVARLLQAVIMERRPKLVFIEGPADAGHLVPFLLDGKTRPPVAIYSSYRDDDNVLGLAGLASPDEDIPARFTSWYPLLAYSPEYVAMKAAVRVRAEVVLMDLPHHALLRSAEDCREQTEAASAGDEDSEQLLADSDFYQVLARQAGFRSWDQAWDAVFEFGGCARDTEIFRRELATFCAAARATTPAERVSQDGTLERERFMRHTITETLQRKGVPPSEAMVVCGGFHLFLDRSDTTAPPAPPAGTVYSAVVPYSFFRVSELAGYGAGNRAPQFYQALWELGSQADLDGLLSRHVVATLKRARRDGESVSSADAISIAQHARLLAALRRRPVPLLDDIHDAIITCCCKGDPEQEGRYLRRAMDAVDIGSRVGVVTPEMGRLPLVNDFYGQLQGLDLTEAVEREKRLTVKLDKRESLDQRRSAFLHRLQFLTIPFCEIAQGGSGDSAAGTLFREVWRLRWSPQVEAELIQRNLYGDTLEVAALALLKEKLAGDAHSAGRTCRRLVEAVDMELPTLVQEIEAACGPAIARDTRFPSLSEALHQLRLLRRHALHQHLRQDVLDALVEQAFERACFALPDSANAPEAEQEAVVEALRVVGETLLGDEDQQLDRELFTQHLQSAAEASQVPYLQGALQGMLTELRVLSPEASSAVLRAFAHEPPERLVAAGDFLEGMLAAGRTSVLLGAEHLVAAIDELLCAAEWDSFLVMLPRLRAAFERLHGRQRDSLADRVARCHGLKEAKDLTELRTSVAAAALFARVDQAVDQIMQRWDL